MKDERKNDKKSEEKNPNEGLGQSMFRLRAESVTQRQKDVEALQTAKQRVETSGKKVHRMKVHGCYICTTDPERWADYEPHKLTLFDTCKH